ncbi:MAG: PD40 domain-containing protein, partial [Candidatus Eremiobacteraeota bacterium]|nr:PD40 domain-containing protein [Candidatus Eremiobacteraeota bacterium]
GTLTGSTPKSQTIVGAFHPDGKRFVFSSEHDSGSGEANGDELQYCWTNASPVAAGCASFKKDK